MAALKIGANDLYNKVTRQGDSVVEIINLLKQKKPALGELNDYSWASLQGYVLAMRRRDDKFAESLLTQLSEGEPNDESELIRRIAHSHDERGGTLNVIVKRIDTVAQFMN